MSRSLACAVALLLVGAAAASAATTTTHVYRAFKADGKPAIHIAHTVDGSCFGGAEAVNRRDAWRCISGKAHRFVLCPAAPWKRSGIKIHLLSTLKGGHRRAPSTAVNPWGIQTTAGLRCAFAGGATNAIGRRRANYACLHSHDWLWVSPIRSTQPWTIFMAPVSAKKLARRAKIAVAWF